MIEQPKQIDLFSRRGRVVKKPCLREGEIQAAFFSWLRLYESRFPELRFCFAVPNGGFRFKSTAAMMKRTGTRAGVPDVFLPVPNACFSGLWIEFKSGAGKASDAQTNFMRFLEKQDYKVLICRTWTEAANNVIDYLSLPLARV